MCQYYFLVLFLYTWDHQFIFLLKYYVGDIKFLFLGALEEDASSRAYPSKDFSCHWGISASSSPTLGVGDVHTEEYCALCATFLSSLVFLSSCFPRTPFYVP